MTTMERVARLGLRSIIFFSWVAVLCALLAASSSMTNYYATLLRSMSDAPAEVPLEYISEKKYVDTSYTRYIPAPIEDYVIKNAGTLGYNTTGKKNSAGCHIWNDTKSSDIYNDLQTYEKELQDYNARLNKFKAVPDLRLSLDDPNICDSVELHPDGLKGIFKSGQLSLSASGYVEPLLPPLRHPQLCVDFDKHLMNMAYLVHDFGAMCRQLKRHSRTVLIDMGASLAFHDGAMQPAVYLTEMFEKFGFPFDHIYAYEITKQNPKKVFELVPDKLQAAYHWINVAVDPKEGAQLNPFTTLLSKYNNDDLIVVKLDVDTPSVELPLAHQLLKDDRLGELVDQFYFEHHVHLKELAPAWRAGMKGSVKDSLDLFFGLRQKGVPAHYWP